MPKKTQYERDLVLRLRDAAGGASNNTIAHVTDSNPESVRRWLIAGRPPVYFLAELVQQMHLSARWMLTGSGRKLFEDERRDSLRHTSTADIVAELARRIDGDADASDYRDGNCHDNSSNGILAHPQVVSRIHKTSANRL